MSDPLRGETRPSRPYGGAQRDTPAGRDPRMLAGAGWAPAGSTAAPGRGAGMAAGREPGIPGREPGRPERDSGGNGRIPGGTGPRVPGGNGPRTPGGTDPRIRDPRWGGREPGGNGRDAGAGAARVADPGAGAATRRVPGEPGASLSAPSPLGARGGGRAGVGTRGGGMPNPRRRGQAQGPRPRGRLGPWGALQGGLGVCLVVASTALGAIVTTVAGKIPGGLLGTFVVIGTIAAALAVRPGAGRMILPVPVLSYLVAALVSGVIYNRGTGASNTALAIGAAQWIANGFFPMALATALAIVIIIIRWFLWRRHRSVTPSPAWSVPAAGPVRGPPRPPVSRDTPADSGYPAGYRDPGAVRDGGGTSGWNRPPSPGPAFPGPPDPGSPGYRRPGPRPGSGPYNFSSGA